MHRGRINRLTRVGLIGIAILCLARGSLGAEDDKARIRKTKARIKVAIKACRKAESDGKTPDVGDLRKEFASLAVDAKGLTALAKFQDHPVDYVALLAVRAIASAPAELRLLAGRILSMRLDARYLEGDRRIVYIETVRALGRTGYLAGVPSLLGTLRRTKEPAVCQTIVEALGRLGDPQVLAVLLDRLNTGSSANLRGLEAGSQARRRSQNPRQQKGADGKKNNVKVTLAGRLIETLAGDVQPVDEKKVVLEIYATISKILGAEFGDWHEIDKHLRKHKSELKRAAARVQKKRKEQEREASKLLR